eukprot:GFYU01004772.1.p1 GENE.GFYU01004772.1~~GFYU01004772.1.p1  ORF type:complete len:419 (-),score=73.26 GFYU01004772.1:139-1395(-)
MSATESSSPESSPEYPVKPAPMNVSFGRKVALFITGGATQCSFFITFFTVDYFNYFFKTYAPEFWLSLLVSGLSFIGAMLTIIWPFEKNYKAPMVSFYLASAVFAVFVPLAVYLAHNDYITWLDAFILDVALLSALGFFESLNSGCVFSFLGKHYGAEAVGLAQSGTTWVSLTLYCLRVILKASVDDDTPGFLLSGYLEFALVAAWMVVCAGLSYWITSDVKGSIAATEAPSTPDYKLVDGEDCSKETVAESDDGGVRQVYDEVKHLILSMVLGLVFNQMFYPGVFSVIQGTASNWSVMITFGAFAIGDTIGQSLPTIYPLYSKKNYLAYPIVQAILTVAMVFAMQNDTAQDVFKSDAYISVLAFIWGFNVGSGVCCHMMMIVDQATNKGLASTCAVVVLQLGLILAAGCAFLVKLAM